MTLAFCRTFRRDVSKEELSLNNVNGGSVVAQCPEGTDVEGRMRKYRDIGSWLLLYFVIGPVKKPQRLGGGPDGAERKVSIWAESISDFLERALSATKVSMVSHDQSRSETSVEQDFVVKMSKSKDSLDMSEEKWVPLYVFVPSSRL
jgi:hypothetical protein